MNITYIYNSGFILEQDSYALIIDCIGLKKDSAEIRRCAGKFLYILASHVHGDHFDRNIMTFSGAGQQWILSDDIRRKVTLNSDIHFLAKGDIYRDARLSIKAYGSTDAGISFYIEAGDQKIFHAGDLNNWHWNEDPTQTPEEAVKDEQRFLDELAQIAVEVPALDIAMFPVDPRLGTDYTRGAQQFLDSIRTDLFIPMHFQDKFEAARAFKPEAERRGCRYADINAAGDVVAHGIRKP